MTQIECLNCGRTRQLWRPTDTPGPCVCGKSLHHWKQPGWFKRIMVRFMPDYDPDEKPDHPF